jgi:hypothetical protein
LHGVAAACFNLPLGVEDLFGGGAGFVLARLDIASELLRLTDSGLEETAMLGALLGDAGQLGTGLLEFGSCGRDAGFEFADALGVAALAGGGALEFDSGFIGAVLRFVTVAFELIAALGELVLAGLLLGDDWSASMNAMRLARTTRRRPRNSSRTAANRSALAAWRLREFIWRVTSSKMSSTRARFCRALSRRNSARRFLVLKRVMPAASSMMARRS